MALTPREIEHALAGYDTETLAAWATDLNCFDWPDACPLPCPEGWYRVFPDRRALEQVRMALGKPLWDYLHQRLSDADLSRAWWLLKLGRTEDEWQAWWDDPAQSAFAKARHAVYRRDRNDSAS